MVCSINCHTTNISKYIDYHIQPIGKQIPSYVKSTNDFINKINAVRSILKNSYLGTMNVGSLYASIPNAEGISALKRAYDNYSKKTTITKVITTIVALISVHYLEIKRCTMDTIWAPTYLIFELKYIYPYI